MKKIVILIVLTITIISCTAEDIRIWNENTEERKARGRDCAKTSNGYTVCGDTR